MRLRAISWVLGVMAASGCAEQEGEPLCLSDCGICTKTQCPPDRCGVLVVLSGDCEGKAPLVEVALEQCLEGESLTPGSSLQACGTVTVNQTRMVTARADDWIWQRAVTCTPDKAGRIVVLTLSCADEEVR